MVKTALVLIPVYKRPEVTIFCMDAMLRLQAEALTMGWDIKPCYVGDEDWMFYHADERYFSALHADNDGIGRKMNKALDVWRDREWDWLITSGSDNIYRKELFASADYMAAEGFRFFGTNGLYLYDTTSGKSKIVDSGPQIIGAGRFVHRSLVERCEYKLWPDDAMSGLDGRSEDRIERVTSEYVQHLPACRPFVIDIKSEVNIHSFDSIPGYEMDTGRIEKLFSVKFSVGMGGLRL